MKQRQLGQGLLVSEMGLGTMGMTSYYGAAASEQDALRVIYRALDLGVTFLDTAEAYGPFTKEELVGKALKGRREGVVLATKFAYDFLPNGERRLNGRPEHVIAACEGSLKRLGVDSIDLYYQHRLDPHVPIEETVGAMAHLVKQGKIRHLGLSEVGPQTIRRAHAVHPLTALQTEYSLWERGPEAQILPLLRELGIGFVAYSPLGRGFLTGQITSPADLPASDFRHTDPRFQGEHFARNFAMVERVQQLAREKGVTPGQIALAWVLHKGEDIVPIPGTKHIHYLEENIAATTIALSAAEIARIEEVVGTPAGARYAEAMMRLIANAE
jgi:aryl-alcohol dehydrogenase-like predicted oxidoreductase